MSSRRLVFLGLSLSSSWGNGHATTYRALLKALARRGHQVLFLEREQPWYARHRDLEDPDYCQLAFYRDTRSLSDFRREISEADAVVVGSFVPDGCAVARFVQKTAGGTMAFYDIDTPVTLAKLDRGEAEYLSPDLIRGFDVYLSFTGGPVLETLQVRYGARAARPLYCSVDPEHYCPIDTPPEFDLGYLGTYSDDRQPALERLLIEAARRAPSFRFLVAGALYPGTIDWPANVTRVEHIPPDAHPDFYGSCRYALNVTRRDMIRMGYSPSVRLFEAAACGTPIVSDNWPGIETIFHPGKEIALVGSTEEVLAILRDEGEASRKRMARAARKRILDEHTSDHRAEEFERYVFPSAAPAGRETPAERVSV